MTVFVKEQTIEHDVLHWRGDRAAASLIAATAERQLKADADRAELRREPIDWGTLDIMVRRSDAGYVVKTSVQAGVDSRDPWVPDPSPTPHFQEHDHRVLAADAAVRGMAERLDAVGAILREMGASPSTLRLQAALEGREWEPPSAEAGEQYRH